jgi:GNAT superfamily N-acetyltransferase
MAMGVTTRLMAPDDVAGAVEAWRLADVDLRQRLHLPPNVWNTEATARTERRVTHLLHTDPEGAWVADDGGEVVGIGQAHRREGLFVLSHLFVAPRAQDRGVGRELLERTLAYGSPDDPGLIIASPDPRAIKRYALAGFALRPCVVGWGQVRREGLGATPDVRDGGPEDLELTAAIDRFHRGAAKMAEIELCMAEGDRLLVAPDRGYALLRGSRVVVLGALDQNAATQLLTSALAEASTEREAEVNRMTAAQGWAIAVTLAAGLEVHPAGPILVRGDLGPMTLYLPDGALG